MKILVIGGAGFVGSHIIDRLQLGHEVTCFDIKQPRKRHNNVKYMFGDITDSLSLEWELSIGYDVVYHLASVSNTMECVIAPYQATLINCLCTVNVLKACSRPPKVKRVIVAGSSLVSGLMKPGCVDISMIDIEKSNHLYVTTKVFQEMVTRDFYNMNGLSYTILRYGICYGPRMTPGVVVHTFIKQALEGKPLTIDGDGSQKRQYIYVEDLADANVLALNSVAKNNTYNITPTNTVTIKEIADCIVQLIPGTEVVYREPRSHDLDINYLTTWKTKRDLKWEASTFLKDGLQKTIDYYRRYGF